ncbi:type I-E CRISPR-associated protein Cse1/CasA [Marinobacter sp. MMG032]|uniref:Type I-E CRISPR-associated protein Cse1/CasA n=1 Tax=Marinobacter sp. MMG032 TaxID=3158548 RepID=A0AAU7MQ31_9GAMM
MENRFNLVDEPWIPVADVGNVSLRQVFENTKLRMLGGTPVQKVAVTKLLLAIAQAAATPDNEDGWRSLGSDGLAKRCCDYLDRWYDRFYLYGDQPFLQMPEVSRAAVQSFGATLPEISTGNTTVLSQSQVDRELTDSEKAVLIVSLMGFALAGKKTDNKVTLTPGYRGKLNNNNKPSSSKPGPSLGFMGFLHSLLLGSTLHETLWLNMLTHAQVQQTNMFPEGVGTAPWEAMPEGEDCATARALAQSLQGRLVPLCRFCLLTDSGLHYSEGVPHPGYKEGVVDPTVAINYSGKEPKALWVNPEKRPWRELTSLLSFIGQEKSQGFHSHQIALGLGRVRDVMDSFAIWSGGLRVSSNAGEQYVSGSDDFVESIVWLDSDLLGAIWFSNLKAEMDALDTLAKGLYGRVSMFFKEQKMDGSKLAAQASHLFWQLCERRFQDLVDSCGTDPESQDRRTQLRRQFAGYVHQAYDQICPRETARQLDAWAKCRPNTRQFLQQETVNHGS